MSLLLQISNEIIGATWRGSLLIVFIFALRLLVVRALPLKVLPWLWLVVAIKLMLLAPPSGWWSLYNLTALAHFFHAAPAMLTTGPVPLPGVFAFEPSPLPSATHDACSWNWTSLLSFLWLLGIVILSAVQAGAYYEFRRQLAHDSASSGPRWAQVLEECAALVGVRAPALVETHAIGSPAVTGLLRPKLLVPTGLLERLDSDEARLIFVHELSHLRRRDLFLLTFFSVARTIHWFNPLVWLAERALRADCEAACDADVLRLTSSSSRHYGETLLRLTQLISPSSISILVAAVSKNSGQTERRLQMIMRYQKPARWATFAVLLLAVAIGLLTLPNEVVAQEQPVANASTAGPDIDQQLQKTTLSLDFKAATIEEATAFLSSESKRLDPKHQGIGFIITPDASKSAKPFDLKLENVSLGEALQYVCQLANVKFAVGDDAIQIVSATDTTVTLTDTATYQPSEAATEATKQKLQNMVFDKVNFNQLDVSMVLLWLHSESKTLDPDKAGMNFVLGNIGPNDNVHRPVSVVLDNVRMNDVLGYIITQTNLKYTVEGSTVYFTPNSPH